MTVHVLHAGNGYTYLTRTVAAHDTRLGRSEALADYYTAKGQPPGHWAGRGADLLGVTGTVTEEQMRNLFGEGRHPDADTVTVRLGCGRRVGGGGGAGDPAGSAVPAVPDPRRGGAAGEGAVLTEQVVARVDPHAAPKKGQTVWLRIRPGSEHVFSTETGKRLSP